MTASMIQKWWWPIIHASYLLLREVDCSCTSKGVSDNACSPPNEDPSEPKNLKEFDYDSRVRSATLPCASKVLSGDLTCSQTYHNHCNRAPGSIIRDPSHSEGRPEYPLKVWYSPEIDTSKFTLHILSDTPGVFQRLKYILLMCTVIIWIVVASVMTDFSNQKASHYILGCQHW